MTGDVLSQSAAEQPIDDAALLDLVERGVLSREQAIAVRDALRTEHAKPASPRLRVNWSKVVGYLGGGLLLTGAILLTASTWERLSEVARTGLVGTFAVALLVAGGIAAGGPAGLWHGRRRDRTARLRVASALLALGAGAAALTVGVALPDASGTWGPPVAAGVGFVLAAAGYALLPIAFGLVAATVLGLLTVVLTLDVAVEMTQLVAGLGLVSTGLVLTILALSGVVRDRWLGVGMGLAIVIVGAQQPLFQDGREPVGYLLTFAIGIGCLILWQRMRKWLLAGFGVVAVALAVPEAIWHVADGAVGAAAIPLIAGVVLLVASGVGLRRRNATPRA